MKNIFKAALVLGLASSMTALTGCIEEVQPTDGITQGQLDTSVQGAKAVLFAIPARMVEYSDGFDWHGNFSYPGMMQIRDRILDEMICAESGTDYNQWVPFEQLRFSQDYWYGQVIWNYYTSQILATNKACAIYPEDIESESGKGARAKALAYRVMLMLDCARWYEFLPNKVTSNINAYGNDVLHLTIPIVTEKTTEEEARNNPRVSRDKMVEFLLGDLKYCEENIKFADSDLNTMILPDLACVYGLYARLYLWIEDYPNAALYAQKAIDESKKMPLTEAQWTDPKNGFNTLNAPSWMWGINQVKETSSVLTGICNFTSMVSVETDYGYAGVGAGAYPSVGYSFYSRIGNNDFRKLSWCPRASATSLIRKLQLNSYSTNGEKQAFCRKFEYGAVKFRPGEGDCSNPSVGSATALPLMRVEEMHFIKIEATAHSNPAEGKTMLEDFMNTYRMSSGKYTCNASDVDGVVEEIVFQKRVEFWGEGLNMFDVKRLGYSVTRAYTNTNFYPASRFNSDGRPAWLNLQIVRTEGLQNSAVTEWNNPNTVGLYEVIE